MGKIQVFISAMMLLCLYSGGHLFFALLKYWDTRHGFDIALFVAADAWAIWVGFRLLRHLNSFDHG